MYEIRIFNERFNMDPNYYEGNKDVKIKIQCETSKELIEKWEELLETEEGETYAVWEINGNDSGIIVAGAFDPNDIGIIQEEI